MITQTDNPEPEKKTVLVKLKKAIFVKGQGAKKAGDIVEIDAAEARELTAYNLWEVVPASEVVPATK
jgi:hypothetical protein